MGLNIICRHLNLDPDQILNLGRENGDKIPKDLKTRIKVLLNEYVQQGKLGEAKKIYASLRSFLDSREVAVVFACVGLVVRTATSIGSPFIVVLPLA
jgi:hypothetical protein